MKRVEGNAIFMDWCGRPALYSCRHAPSAACRSSRLERSDVVEQLVLQCPVLRRDHVRPGRNVGIAFAGRKLGIRG